ncbi:F-box protein At4g35930-like [Malania oleifera]|uniref:F-box protein At4g35930-like n=1 Tax=Malania oleifera TaxID=397392 RepID=UPI0025ADC87C|nr:F-box protein At4g35930-like [Malania oleifera]
MAAESSSHLLPFNTLIHMFLVFFFFASWLCKSRGKALRVVLHISERIRKAVLLARQLHFNYTTPDRSRQEMLSTMTPLPTEHWPIISKRDGKSICIPSPHTPKATKHGPRPPRTKLAEMRQITAVLFPESALPSRCMVPSVLASSQVLFYEDELCQGVAQNKLP